MLDSGLQPGQNLKVGQKVEKDIIAPFDFPVLKSKAQLEQEKQILAKSIKPVYQLSDDIQFEVIKSINDIFIPLINPEGQLGIEKIKSTFQDKNITISDKTAQSIQNKNFTKALYEFMQKELETAYQIGIYDVIIPDSIYVVRHGTLEKASLDKLLSVQESLDIIKNKSSNASVANALNDILPRLIIPNLLKDQNKFDEIVGQEAELIPKSLGTVSRNEILIKRNTRLTEDDLYKIQSLASIMEETGMRISFWKSLLVSVSIFIYYFILGFMLYYFCKYFYNNLLKNRFHFSHMIAGLAINAVFAILNNQIFGLQTLLIPYSMTIITAAILIDIPFAMFYNFVSFACIYPFVNWETFSPLVLALATSGVLLLMKRLNDKHQYFTIWLYLVISTILLTIIFAMYNIVSIATLLANLGYAFISSTLSVILTLFIIPFLEKKWHLATRQQLLELLDFSHPLLKKLVTEAVGTYYHSLIVGNLAERAAEAIGADSILARVGSYYHDIGKISNPEYFTENNPDSAKIHDALSPSESAKRIKEHVKEGLIVARKYNIPVNVLDIILQHHGTGYIRYFLDKAEKSNVLIDLEQFKYSGPKPKSKEATLVMIADIVESVAKSWNDINPQDIRKILNETIFRLVREGQFDDSPITLNDLSKVRDSMIPILESIHRKRQQYPDESMDYE
jgi:putative nucleotidyltransferase with HDIG domain